MSEFNLNENEQKPLSPGLFGIYVLKRLRQVEGVEVVEQKELDFKLKIGGRDIAAHLDRFYERYRAQPEHLAGVVGDWIEAIQLLPAPATDFKFDEIAMHILPMLKPRGFIEQANRSTGAELVSQSFVGNLAITYVVDAAKTIEYVNTKELEQWGVDAETLYTRAMQNLVERSAQIEFEQFGEGADRLIVDQNDDGYAATRILVDDYISFWAENVEGELLIGIPNRDFMIGFSHANPNREALAMQIGKDAHTRENPLSSTLLVWRDGRIREYSE